MHMKCLAERSKISVYGSYKYYAHHRKLERTEKYKKDKKQYFPLPKATTVNFSHFFFSMQSVFIQI